MDVNYAFEVSHDTNSPLLPARHVHEVLWIVLIIRATFNLPYSMRRRNRVLLRLGIVSFFGNGPALLYGD